MLSRALFGPVECLNICQTKGVDLSEKEGRFVQRGFWQNTYSAERGIHGKSPLITDNLKRITIIAFKVKSQCFVYARSLLFGVMPVCIRDWVLLVETPIGPGVNEARVPLMMAGYRRISCIIQPLAQILVLQVGTNWGTHSEVHHPALPNGT